MHFVPTAMQCKHSYWELKLCKCTIYLWRREIIGWEFEFSPTPPQIEHRPSHLYTEVCNTSKKLLRNAKTNRDFI